MSEVTSAIVAFINGVPGSGKDEFVKLLKQHQQNVHTVSSIDCIRRLLDIPETRKDPKTRKVLSKVGSLLEEYNSFRSNSTSDAVLEVFSQNNETIPLVFVHTREVEIKESIIEKLRTKVSELVVLDLLIDRQESELEIYGNDSDAEAADRVYYFRTHENYTDKMLSFFDSSPVGPDGVILINNNGGLEQLDNIAATFMKQLTEKGLLPCYK